MLLARPVRTLAALTALLAAGRASAQAPAPVAPGPVPPAAVPGPAPVPPGGAPQPPAAVPQATTYLWITTTDPRVSLQRRIGSLERPRIGTGVAQPGSAPGAYGASSSYGAYWESDWERVCVTPCQMPVATGGVYRIGGEGITPSEGFPVRPGRMHLDVAPGSASAKSFGGYAAVFGFLIAAAGGVFLGTSVASDEQDTQDFNRTFGAIGAAGLIGGGVLGIVGVILAVANGTEVRDESGKVIGSRPSWDGAGRL